MIVSFKLITAAVVLVICGVSGVMAQQATPTKLRVIEYNGDFTSILASLPNAFGVTVGVELELDAQPYQRVRVSLMDATLPDVMNATVQSSGKYQWHEAGGFVDVWPLTGSNPLLDTRISNFNVKDLSPSQAFDQLLNLSEVQANMKTMKLRRRAPDVTLGKVSYSKLSTNLEGVTLRQALSKIAQESGIQIWIFRNYPDRSFSISTVER